jgi:hypothetical protein
MATLLGRPNNVGDAFTIIRSIEVLNETYNSVKADEDLEVCWKLAAVWLKDVPRRFHEMVDELHQVALVVMGCWVTILISRIERQGCWFFRGVARASVSQDAERLVAERHDSLPLILDFEHS